MSRIITITVNDKALIFSGYGITENIYVRTQQINTLTPIIDETNGGAITSYSITPSLPTGLNFNTVSGVISGTPTIITSETEYTITASNSSGNVSHTIRITVTDKAPIFTGYTSSSYVGVVGQPFNSSNPVVDEVNGGIIISYTVTPPLPNGINLNPTSGVMSGTPTDVVAQANYTISATNSGGSVSRNISFIVNDKTPIFNGYASSSNTYVVNQPISAKNPIIDETNGGTIISYSVVPALPNGLILDTASGVISGAPTTVSQQANYTIMATNSGGSVSRTISITVKDKPPIFTGYSSPTNTYILDIPINANEPVVDEINGGAIVSFAVTPSLPTGLSIDTSSGNITGTPTTLQDQDTYTITATNSGGSVSQNITIVVNDVGVSITSYTNENASYTINEQISTNQPSIVGGAPEYFSLGQTGDNMQVLENANVNVINSNGNKYVFNNQNAYVSNAKYRLFNESYTLTNIPSAHPLAIIDNTGFLTYTGDANKKSTKVLPNGNTYDFYFGTITITVTGNFNQASAYCYYHGYMGGENVFQHNEFASNNVLPQGLAFDTSNGFLSGHRRKLWHLAHTLLAHTTRVAHRRKTLFSRP